MLELDELVLVELDVDVELVEVELDVVEVAKATSRITQVAV